MHIVPDSLFGRLVLVLLAGLLGAQLLSAAILFQDRGLGVYGASGLQSAQRFADIVRLFDTIPASERQQFIRIFNSPSMWLATSDAPSLSDSRADPQRGLGGIFRALLRRHLPDDRPFRVSVTEAPAEQPIQYPMGHMHRPGMGMAHAHHMMNMGVLPPESLGLAAEIQLRDGSWLHLEHRVSKEVFEWSQRLLLTLGVLLLSVVLLSIVAVRWVSRPLSLLADAADRLGRDIDQPPLQEGGPSEVRRAARAFNTMQGRLARFIEDRTRIMSALSHDLRTPITRLSLRAELIEDPELQSSVTRDLEEMQHMTEEALDFLRGVEEREPIQSIDVPALLENVKDDVEDTGGEILLERVLATPYPGRPLALKRCITNLLKNACTYGRRAQITVHDQPDRLEIRIADEGPGLPADQLEQVFEPFYRLEASRSRDTGGAGLGLPLARNIARAHGGDLVLRNLPGVGLEAILTLAR
jgi:signal transduction histidine kinase